MKTQSQRIVFQSALEEKELDMLKKVAAYKGVKMSAAFRAWVAQAYNRLPAEAK